MKKEGGVGKKVDWPRSQGLTRSQPAQQNKEQRTKGRLRQRENQGESMKEMTSQKAFFFFFFAKTEVSTGTSHNHIRVNQLKLSSIAGPSPTEKSIVCAEGTYRARGTCIRTGPWVPALVDDNSIQMAQEQYLRG